MKKIIKNLIILVLTFSPCALQSGMLPDSTGITITETNTSLENVLKEVARQSGYKFEYNNHLFKNKKKVSVNLKNTTLKNALNICLKDQPITYTIDQRNVFLNSDEMNSDESGSLFALLLLYYTDRSFKIYKTVRKWPQKIKRKLRKEMRKWLRDLLKEKKRKK
ncbi:hypothetical protein A4D02_10815 [Niastella koreensis]|uniref:Secretin/TonB short N-terminal domain-containing protein n=2 Tax=Niastella koreensis TaxID=354356 RepID=G8T721_NIAKG|nr:STN domain-containing protein [Niastella koreensis]AEV99042.1 hypothetical protein Niako_2703 [Niastella koreensis GR20-10]OQP43959.1 hypothetical protein A4D02_10815 [Niastella koreensis]